MLDGYVQMINFTLWFEILPNAKFFFKSFEIKIYVNILTVVYAGIPLNRPESNL